MNTLLTITFTVATLLLGLALILSVLRVLLGPTTADRIVAVDMASYVAIGLAAILSLTADEPVLLDAALVVAVAAFIGTLYLARHLEQAGGKRQRAEGSQ